jgi:hypothetical protein
MVVVGEYKGEISARTRWSAANAARYEGWLYGKYPLAHAASLEQKSVPRPNSDLPREKEAYQARMAKIELMYAEGLEIGAMIIQFATLASRLKSLVTSSLNVGGVFSQPDLFAAFDDYANSPLGEGFWFEVVKEINDRDFPPGDKAVTGADPNSTPPG